MGEGNQVCGKNENIKWSEEYEVGISGKMGERCGKHDMRWIRVIKRMKGSELIPRAKKTQC